MQAGSGVALIGPCFRRLGRVGDYGRPVSGGVVNAIFYVRAANGGCCRGSFRRAARLRLLPGLGPRACIWAHVHDVLYRLTRELEGRDETPSAAIIDSQTVKTGVNLRWVSSSASARARDVAPSPSAAYTLVPSMLWFEGNQSEDPVSAVPVKPSRSEIRCAAWRISRTCSSLGFAGDLLDHVDDTDRAADPA